VAKMPYKGLGLNFNISKGKTARREAQYDSIFKAAFPSDTCSRIQVCIRDELLCIRLSVRRRGCSKVFSARATRGCKCIQVVSGLHVSRVNASLKLIQLVRGRPKETAETARQ